MDIDVQRSIVSRSARRHLFVHVMTQPSLGECWSLNISPSGIGLVATGEGVERVVREGEPLNLELVLPESGVRLEVRGRVVWRQLMGRLSLDQAPTLALGVRFEELSSEHRLALARYLAEYRFKVVAHGATLAQRHCLERALVNEADLELSRTEEELLDLLTTGDVAALVVCGTAEDEAPSLVERYSSHLSAGRSAAYIRDAGARVVYYGPADAAELVRLFNEGKLVQALPALIDEEQLREAVLDACREHGVRTEQRRTALALGQALLRERGRAKPRARPGGDEGAIVAESAEMRRVGELVRSIAGHSVSVLLTGETGTGKEVFSRAIHELSERSAGPYVVQDCGTLTETLLDSELFGHAKGAFTGATSDHPGLFVLADGGTIFLDEIENTTPALQAKLLRVLETGEVRPVGGTRVRKVDVRVVCATNRDLADAVAERSFRADLYFRLSAFPIELPPLRQRRDDILPLARRFLVDGQARLGIRAGPLTLKAQHALYAYSWPGNVRELKNVMERALVLCRPGQPIGAEHLPAALERGARLGEGEIPARQSLQERVEAFERDVIARALLDAGGVLQRAAEALVTNRITLARKAKRYGLYRGRDGSPS